MKLTYQLGGIVALSIVIGILFFFDVRGDHPWSTLYSYSLSLMCMMGLMTLGAAWFFVSGLDNFKAELRKAYVLLCIAVVAFGFSQSQLVLVAYLDAIWWLTNGLFTLPYLLSFIFFFRGMRQFAKTLDIKTRWTSWWWAITASLAGAIVVILLPYAPTALTYVQHASTVGFITIDGIFFLFATMATLRIMREIGPMYKAAMGWLAAGLVAALLGAIHYVIVEMVVRVDWYYEGNLTALFLLASAALLLRAGYAVRLINHIPDQYVPEVNPSEPSRLIDIISYSAALTSRPTEIDPILDDLRLVSSGTQVGQALSASQQHTLISVYRRIEDYLVSKEPLRIYTRESLKQAIVQKFHLDSDMTKKLWEA